MRAVRINESEAVFERFMDPVRSQFPSWTVESDAGTGGSASQFWCAVKVDWDKGGDRTVCSLSRKLRMELEDYDRLIIRLSLSATASLRVAVVVDGHAAVPIDRAFGKDNYSEFEGPVIGKVLQEIRIEITDSGDVPGVSMISWLGLCNTGRRQAMLDRSNPYPEAWEDMILPQGNKMDLEPTIGLFFGGEDLDQIRKRADSATYHPLTEALREKARSYVGGRPWLGITREYNLGKPIYGRDRDTSGIDVIAMRLCSFIGLIDRDEQLLRTALDHALSAAHCEYWTDGFMMTVAGTAHEHRAFVAYRTAVNVAFALDWAGSLLTPAGKQVIAHALVMKGLPSCLMSLMKHDYMRGCNQGVYMAYGALIIEATLARMWPRHGGELIETAKTAIDETVNRYLADDGGAFEGMGYVSSTVSHALVAYQAYARLTDTPFAEVVPKKLLLVADYFSTMISTAGPAGTSVNVADGGRPGEMLFGECLAPLYRLSSDRPVGALLAAIIPRSHEKENAATPGGAFILIGGPDELPAAGVKPSVFSLLPHTGQLCSCRRTSEGLVRLQLIGAPAAAGHTHEDKGSFILEAFGEEILIDRGQMNYSDPRSSVLSYARFHNLMIPDGPDGEPVRQVNPCPTPVIPEGTGDRQTLDCAIDGSLLYPELVSNWRRSIRSDRAGSFELTDSVGLTGKTTVALHFHSRHPWRQTREGWVTEGKRCRLSLLPRFAVTEERASEDFVDGSGVAVYHLTVRSPASKTHELPTTLTVTPCSLS